MSRARAPFAFSILFFAFACAKANVTALPGGGHRIVCERGMKLCIVRADKVCGDDGYTIVSGTTKKRLLGGDGSSYREMAESAELIISCGVEPPPAQEEMKYVALPPRTDQPIVTAANACVPGATQVCVGPGACQGGQVCQADGAAFGPCDCGSVVSTPAPVPPPGPVPPPSPASPSPAPSVAPAPKVPGALPPAEPL